MLDELGVPLASATEASTSDLQRLRDLLYGDQSRLTEERLSDLETRLETLRRELGDTLFERVGALTESSAAQLKAVYADLAERLDRLAAQTQAIEQDLRDHIDKHGAHQAAQLRAAQKSLIDRIDKQDAQLRAVQQELNERLEKIAASLRAQLRATHQELIHELARLSAEVAKQRALPKARVAPSAIVEKSKWARDIEQWKHVKSDPGLARQFVRFFRLAFEWLPERTLQAAWFGVHADRISLTVGNTLLAAVVASNQTAWLLVDTAWDNPAKSTRKYSALGWKTRSWEQVAALNRSPRVWKSYATAAEKIWDSPVSRREIGKNLVNKRRVRIMLGLARSGRIIKPKT